ncbi:hypothetical protein BpHYR1_051814 [Brachionus plicatilis]|uniref:Uncharacterized protein n=1 Tax=Brachionus plicatilis TaxID=10195 RepID=A0A3M7QFB7_BRAPC|nr:hypothetical protein BpHYR1_051814 [Brachionus plicatilis]
MTLSISEILIIIISGGKRNEYNFFLIPNSFNLDGLGPELKFLTSRQKFAKYSIFFASFTSDPFRKNIETYIVAPFLPKIKILFTFFLSKKIATNNEVFLFNLYLKFTIYEILSKPVTLCYQVLTAQKKAEYQNESS